MSDVSNKNQTNNPTTTTASSRTTRPNTRSRRTTTRSIEASSSSEEETSRRSETARLPPAEELLPEWQEPRRRGIPEAYSSADSVEDQFEEMEEDTKPPSPSLGEENLPPLGTRPCNKKALERSSEASSGEDTTLRRRPGPASLKKKKEGNALLPAAAPDLTPIIVVSEEERNICDGGRALALSLPEVSAPLARFMAEKAAREKTEDEMSIGSVDSVASVALSKKETRGRPPTSGKYVGVGKAREELQCARLEAYEEETMRRRVRAETTKRNAREAAGFSPLEPPLLPPTGSRAVCGPKELAALEADSSDEELRKRSPGEMLKRLEAGVTQVLEKSKNLKGTRLKDLKEAAETIMQEARNLRSVSRSEENDRLQREVKKLRRDHAELQRDFAKFRKEARTAPITTPAPGPSSTHPFIEGLDVEGLTNGIIAKVSALINARMEVIEHHIRNERSFRPPLGRMKDPSSANSLSAVTEMMDLNAAEPPPSRRCHRRK